jgi:hypothetical protein
VERLMIKPFLRRWKTVEAGDRRSEIDRFPFRVEARRLQLVNTGKQEVDKAGDALIAV